MLSELREMETHLSRFVRDRWYFKRFIEPCPNISVSPVGWVEWNETQQVFIAMNG